MKVGYLLNTYPSTSQTFIRREIRALEALDVDIVRYAIRKWSEPLVDADDRVEEGRTRYILTGRLAPLLGSFLTELFLNPVGMMRALRMWFRLLANAGGGLVRHCAYLLEAATVKRWASRDEVALLHTHFSTNAAAVALLCERMGGPPYTFTAHGPDELDDSRSSLAEKVEGARAVVTISSFCRAQIARLVGLHVWPKLRVIRCGIDPDEFPPSDAPFDGNLTFVSVGRLCAQKAQLLIVEAVSKVCVVHPQVRVLLVGDGPDRRHIEAAIARFKVEDHVTVLGWRSNSEVRELLANSRALLLPSFGEGLPIVIMEAQALGRPVITTYVGAIPELVDQDCGWVIPAGCVESIAAAMVACIETPSGRLTRMGIEGRRRVLEAHDIRRNAAALRELFASVTAR